MEFTLESKKVVNYEKPSFKKRAKIWDGAAIAYNQGLPLSLENCVDICTICKVATEKELDEGKYELNEIYEIGGHILNEIFAVELDKKK